MKRRKLIKKLTIGTGLSVVLVYLVAGIVLAISLSVHSTGHKHTQSTVSPKKPTTSNTHASLSLQPSSTGKDSCQSVDKAFASVYNETVLFNKNQIFSNNPTIKQQEINTANAHIRQAYTKYVSTVRSYGCTAQTPPAAPILSSTSSLNAQPAVICDTAAEARYTSEYNSAVQAAKNELEFEYQQDAIKFGGTSAQQAADEIYYQEYKNTISYLQSQYESNLALIHCS